jgi:threonine dehydratase
MGDLVPVEEIRAAARAIADHVERTPTVASAGMTGLLGVPTTLKLELLQRSGSFKPRGVANKLLALSAAERDAGVVAVSGGNHGIAVAEVAGGMDVRATVVVARSAPPRSIERIRAAGADLRLTGDMSSAFVLLQELVDEGMTLLHPFDDPLVVAGQGTCARELDRQTPDLDTVLVAVGGGGLAAGTCSWYTDRVRIVAVEPERAPTLDRALGAGRPVEVEVGGYAADSLGARRIGAQPWASFERWLDDAVLVDDGAIREAQRRLWTEARIAAEPGGAAAFAALLAGAYVPARGERVGVLVSGGNFDPSVLV